MIGISIRVNRTRGEVQSALMPRIAAATQAAALVFVDAARQLVRVRTGRLRAAINAMRRAAPPDTVRYVVGVRSSRGLRGQHVPGDAFYWRFLEEGWTPGRKGAKARRKALQAPRRVSYPFLAPSYRSAQGRALAAFYRRLHDER